MAVDRQQTLSEEIANKIVELGGEVRTDTPEQFGAWIAKAIADWGAVVKAENLQTDG